jgi:hypothetical protein
MIFLLIKATSGDIVDLCLGKLHFNGSTIISEADGEFNIRVLLAGPY